MTVTETIDPRFSGIDRWPTEQAVAAMIEGQLAAVAAVAGLARPIAEAAEAAALHLRRGGRLVYAGAGTSGRIAVQDGVELAPTYGWADERLIYLMAGGMAALTRSVEGAEDDADAARAEIDAAGVGADDVVIGVAASGRTPYTVAAVEAGGAAGALTIGIANNADTPLLAAARHPLLIATGAEAVAGSTRMKAGTAQKAVLNLLSTATMIRLGRVHDGQMVAMQISNAKLVARGRTMVRDLAGVDDATAERALAATGRDIRCAVLVAMGAEPAAATALLDAAGGELRLAIARLDPSP